MDVSSTTSNNVDQTELAKFGALAARWWDPNSEFKPLHDINPLRLAWIDKLVGLLMGMYISMVLICTNSSVVLSFVTMTLV